MKKFYILLVFVLIFSLSDAFSQSVSINTDGSNADASSILDVKATDKGVLVPRVSLTDVTSASPVSSPASGLLVYNTNATVTGGHGVGFYVWNGTSWIKLVQDNDGAFIRNQNTTDQTANFRITGTGRANTSFQSPIYTRADAGTVAIRPHSNSTTAIQLQNAGGTSILNVDATNSRVGIGTPTPNHVLHIVETGDDASIAGLLIQESNIGQALTIEESGNGTGILITATDNGNGISSTTSGAVTTSAVGTFLREIRTSSTANLIKVGLDVESSGTWNGAGSQNIGLRVDVSGGTTNYAGLFNGGNVGIGTATPAAPLEIQRVATSGGPVIRATNYANVPSYEFRRAQGTPASPTITNNNTVIARLRADGYDGSNFVSVGQIEFEVDSTSDAGSMPGRIVFSTTPVGGSVPIERMRINRNGRVGIGTTTPNFLLDVEGGTMGNTNYGNQAGLNLRRANGTQASPADVTTDGSTIGQINFAYRIGGNFGITARIRSEIEGTASGSGDRPANLTFWTTAHGSGTITERMRITNNGDVRINNLAGTGNRNVYADADGTLRTGSTARFMHATYHPFNNATFRGPATAEGVIWLPSPGGDGSDDCWNCNIEINSSSYRRVWNAPYAGRLVKVIIRIVQDSGSNPDIQGVVRLNVNGANFTETTAFSINDSGVQTITLPTTGFSFNDGDRIALGLVRRGNNSDRFEDLDIIVTAVWEYIVTD